MISRLVVFGCSHAEGQFLPGWKTNIGNSPIIYSPDSYAQLLGTHFNLSVDNKSCGGNSNHEILLNILKYDLQSSDYVLITWSFPQRSIVFTDKEDIQLYRTRDRLNEDLGKYFYRAHDQHDLEIRTLEHINYAKLYLESKKIKYRMTWIYPIDSSNSNIVKVDTSDFLLFRVIDVALDKMHPGVNSHREFFNQLKELIKEDIK